MSRRPLPPTIPYVRRRCAAPRFSPRVRARLTLQAASVRMRPAFQLHLQRLPRPVPAAASAPAGRMVPCRRCGCAFRPWRAAGGDSQLFFGTVSCVRRQWASKSAKPLWPDVSVWSVFVARSTGYGQRRAGRSERSPAGPAAQTAGRRSRIRCPGGAVAPRANEDYGAKGRAETGTGLPYAVTVPPSSSVSARSSCASSPRDKSSRVAGSRISGAIPRPMNAVPSSRR